MPYDSPDVPGTPRPEFVVSPSQIGAVLKTIGSLVSFGILFTGSIVGFARDLDVQGALIYLQRDDVLAWLSTLGTFLWLAWRSRSAWVRKFREILLVENVPDELAMLSSDLPAGGTTFFKREDGRIGVEDPAPSRARETTKLEPRLVSLNDALAIPPAAERAAAEHVEVNYDPGPPIPMLAPGEEITVRTVRAADFPGAAPIGASPPPSPDPVIPVIDLRAGKAIDKVLTGDLVKHRQRPEIDAPDPANDQVDRADTPVIQ